MTTVRTLTRPWVLAFAVIVLFATGIAHAATVPWAGQTWHTFKSTGALGQVWSPSMVSISSTGTLTEKISGNTAGGIGATQYHTGATVSADFRFSPGAGKMCMALFASKGHELDFAESKKGDSGRTVMTATVHYGGAANHMIHFKVPGDFTQWHHVQIVWKAGSSVTFLMDGKAFGHATGSAVYGGPMHTVIQTAGANVAGAGAPAQLQVRNFSVS